jgi:hypothetical protein
MVVDDVDCIYLAADMVLWWALVNIIVNLMAL